MGWTAPGAIGTDFAVSEIVTAAKMNSHIADNLRYLKGSDGAVTIDNTLASVMTTGASIEAQGTTNGGNARVRLLAKRTAGPGTVVDWRIFANALSDAGELSIYDTTAAAERLRIDNAGNVGIGASAPQGKLHAVGAGGGFIFLSAAAVAGTLVTLAVAGTVAASAIFWAYDRNNTTGTGVMSFAAGSLLSLGSGGVTYTNTDTMKVDLTAGGAITVQRTAGTNGTHQINMLVLYY